MERLNQAIVIDNGSGTIKAGFAGDELPKSVFLNCVGRPKHRRIMTGALQGDHFIGRSAEDVRGILKLRYPMSKGVIEDMADMERVWTHMYEHEIEAQCEDHPVLITECPINPRKNRETIAEVFFETFDVPALFVSIPAVLSLYASGSVTGLVLDSGDGATHAVPIYQGFAIPNSITRIDVAGRDITKYMQLQLRQSGHIFHTSSEMETVRAIKESDMMYVTRNFEKEMEKDETPLQSEYKLPDGQMIRLTGGNFRAPEILFQPHLIGLEYMGVHECILSAIRSSDLDVRKNLFSSIYLAGGSTLFHGFGDRLLHELRKSTPDMRIKITSPAERKYTTWIGGSILASLNTFSSMWIDSKEYKEEGKSIMHRKTF